MHRLAKPVDMELLAVLVKQVKKLEEPVEARVRETMTSLGCSQKRKNHRHSWSIVIQMVWDQMLI